MGGPTDGGTDRTQTERGQEQGSPIWNTGVLALDAMRMLTLIHY